MTSNRAELPRSIRTTRAIPTLGGVVPAGSVGVMFYANHGFAWLRFACGREVHRVAAAAIEWGDYVRASDRLVPDLRVEPSARGAMGAESDSVPGMCREDDRDFGLLSDLPQTESRLRRDDRASGASRPVEVEDDLLGMRTQSITVASADADVVPASAIHSRVPVDGGRVARTIDEPIRDLTWSEMWEHGREAKLVDTLDVGLTEAIESLSLGGPTAEPHSDASTAARPPRLVAKSLF